MLAVTIMLSTLLVLAYTSTISFTDSAFTRQRQSANGLANQTMEQMRALPFDTIKNGLDNTDLASLSDPNVTVTGSGSSAVYKYGGEEIPRGDNASTVPLVPHQATLTIGPTTFKRSVYVTYYQNNKTANVFRVTVVVTWNNPAVRGTSARMQTQSLFFSPTGCLSTATHPFAAPCQPFLYARGTVPQGSITVTGTIQGIALDHATLSTTGQDSAIQLEQVSSIQGRTSSSGASLKLVNQAEQFLGSQTANSASDNDPSNPAGDYQTASLTPSAGTASASGSGNSITVTASGGDTGATTSTVTATLPTHACADNAGTNQLDNQPCGSSNAKQGGTSSIAEAITAGSNLGSATLASLATAPAAGYSYTHKYAIGQNGLMYAIVGRSLGTLTLGGLPANLVAARIPTGWGGYLVRLTSFSDSVYDYNGSYAQAPTISEAGTISYWNGVGYATKTLAAGAASSIPVAAFHYQDALLNPAVQLDMSSTLSTGGTSATAPAGCNCTQGSLGSPILGDITYRITYNNAVVVNLDIHFDLGQATDMTSYQAAPSG